MKNLLQLPATILLELVGYLTLQENLSLRLVCHCLATIATFHLQSLTKLHIFSNDWSSRQFAQQESIELSTNVDFAATQQNSLILIQPSAAGRQHDSPTERARVLAHLFKNITTLSLHLSAGQFSYLASLAEWNLRLECLIIDLHFYDSLDNSQRRLLWRLIASMTTLERLHILNFTQHTLPSRFVRRLAGRLTELTLTGCSNCNQTLCLLGGAPLESLAIDWLPITMLPKEELLLLKPIARSVRRLTILRDEIPEWILDYLQLCQFLHHLDISMVVDLDATPSLFLQLDSINLFSLAISVHLFNELATQVKISLIESLEYFFNFHLHYTTKFPALTSVRILQLHLHHLRIDSLRYQRYHWFQTLGRVFPNLRRLELFSNVEQSTEGKVAFMQKVAIFLDEDVEVAFETDSRSAERSFTRVLTERPCQVRAGAALQL